MRRWAFNHLRLGTNTFCLLSVLIFVATSALWLRSTSTTDLIQYNSTAADYTKTPPIFQVVSISLESGSGHLAIRRHRSDTPDNIGPVSRFGWLWGLPPMNLAPAPSPRDRTNIQFLGFQLWNIRLGAQNYYISEQGLAIPFWLFLPFAIPPILWLRRWRRSGGRGFAVSQTA